MVRAVIAEHPERCDLLVGRDTAGVEHDVVPALRCFYCQVRVEVTEDAHAEEIVYVVSSQHLAQLHEKDFVLFWECCIGFFYGVGPLVWDWRLAAHEAMGTWLDVAD